MSWSDMDAVRGCMVPGEPDDLELLAAEVEHDPVARAAYEDAVNRESLVGALAEVRRAHGLTQSDVAERVGTTQSVISGLENLQSDPRLSVLQRYARACRRAVELRVTDLGTGLFPTWLREVADGATLRSSLTAATGEDRDDLEDLAVQVSEDPVALVAYQDAVQRSAILDWLVAARKRSGRRQHDLVAAVGVGQSRMSDLENGRTDPRLSTLQRYARACGMVLFAALDKNGSLVGVAADLAATQGIDDAVVAEVVQRTASDGVGELLRRMIKVDNQPGLQIESVLTGTHLSPEATYRTTQSLATRGWLAYSDDQRLKLIPDAATFIGVSIRPDHVRGLVTSLDPARNFDVHRLPLENTSPGNVLDRVTELVQLLLPQAGEPLGVGVELAGPVRGETGVVVFAPDLQPHTEASWQNYPFQAELERRLGGLKTVVANDATALATRELLQHGDQGGLLVVTLSESTKGIGAGVILNGRVITGADGQSGEIGHLRVAGNERICPRCGKDRKGCLETIASGYAMAKELSLPDLPAAARLAESGDNNAAQVFQSGGRALGRVIGDALTWLDAARIVIFATRELAVGEIVSARLFGEGVAEGLAKRSLTKIDYPEYVTLDDWLGPQAAASVVVNDFLERPLEYSNDMMAHTPRQPATSGRATERMRHGPIHAQSGTFVSA